MSDNPMDGAEHATHVAAENASAAMRTGAEAAQSIGQTMGTMGTAAMGEFTKLFSQMKIPGMPDMEALMAAHRRNLETLSAANRVALKGAQAVARRNMEIMQQTMSELTEGMRSFGGGGGGDTPQARTARNADMLKAAYERAVRNMQEVGELIQKSNGEALGLLNTRFTEAVGEVKALVAKGTPSG